MTESERLRRLAVQSIRQRLVARHKDSELDGDTFHARQRAIDQTSSMLDLVIRPQYIRGRI